MAKFFTAVWNLLTSTNEKQGRCDQLVPKAIKFLTSVVEKEWHKKLFGNQAAITTSSEKVMIPQLKLRESDLEMFNFTGVEYVRHDMEGSDIDTRQRTTVDFVRGLCKVFEKEMTTILKDAIPEFTLTNGNGTSSMLSTTRKARSSLPRRYKKKKKFVMS